MYGNLLSTVTNITRDRRDPISTVTPIKSWNEDLLYVDHRAHDNWVVSFKSWSRRSLFSGRARTCRNNPTCEIHESCCASHQNSRPKSFAQKYLPRWTSSTQPQRSKIWGSVSGGDSGKVPAKQRGGWPKMIGLYSCTWFNGIWSLQFLETRIRTIKNVETR